MSRTCRPQPDVDVFLIYYSIHISYSCCRWMWKDGSALTYFPCQATPLVCWLCTSAQVCWKSCSYRDGYGSGLDCWWRKMICCCIYYDCIYGCSICPESPSLSPSPPSTNLSTCWPRSDMQHDLDCLKNFSNWVFCSFRPELICLNLSNWHNLSWGVNLYAGSVWKAIGFVLIRTEEIKYVIWRWL